MYLGPKSFNGENDILLHFNVKSYRWILWNFDGVFSCVLNREAVACFYGEFRTYSPSTLVLSLFRQLMSVPELWYKHTCHGN